jgi:TPR repeat protein
MGAQRSKAESGDAMAQFNLGECYRDGSNGVVQDHKQAFDWFHKAALQGNTKAMKNIGAAYEHGIFIKHVQFLSAERVSILKFNHEIGLGLPRKNEEAMKWYKMAADNGNAEAQNTLGEWFFYGTNGVRTDFRVACNWFKKAAIVGHAQAQFHLGEYYRDDLFDVDYPQSLDWFYKSALQGNIKAMIGIAHAFDKGTTHNTFFSF